ncbi:Pentatricopeptide repeat-containing protein [Apostasia shenzhenica]|uniref:Pentatricopeptide repeat-containing protein n=1 Tax=Apostasia shenzhenica TaxID=1088818 RepID=A0A2H9ZR41_9ASPA|nr:Pentatricopeptide repeat-containing protein [Apostasia shenzhenica]
MVASSLDSETRDSASWHRYSSQVFSNISNFTHLKAYELSKTLASWTFAPHSAAAIWAFTSFCAASLPPLPSQRHLRRPYSSPQTPPLSSRLSRNHAPPSRSRIIDICRAAALSSATHLDRVALSSDISKLSSFHSFSAIRSLVDDLFLSSKDHNPCSISHAIVLFGQAGIHDDALRAFRSSPSCSSLNYLLFASILSKNHSELAKIFRDYNTTYGVTPNLETYNIVIRSFAESGTTGSFYSVFKEMRKRRSSRTRPPSSTLFEGFYRELRFDEVERVLEQMKKHDCHPGLTTCNVRIQALCKLGRSEQAKDLFREMVKSGMKLSWVTYNHLITGRCAAKDALQRVGFTSL